MDAGDAVAITPQGDAGFRVLAFGSGMAQRLEGTEIVRVADDGDAEARPVLTGSGDGVERHKGFVHKSAK